MVCHALKEPWLSFLTELDSLLDEPAQLHCCGGFVAIQFYGVIRSTEDVDFISVVPSVREHLVGIAGKGSALAKKHKLYLDAVTISTPTENYEDRLIPMFPGTWQKLQLFALEAHDLALAKIERNSGRDREDVQQLARGGHLKPQILKDRYYNELRPNLMAHEARHDLTLKLWLELCWPDMHS
jgi:hypothetical protein